MLFRSLPVAGIECIQSRTGTNPHGACMVFADGIDEVVADRILILLIVHVTGKGSVGTVVFVQPIVSADKQIVFAVFKNAADDVVRQRRRIRRNGFVNFKSIPVVFV